MSWARKKQERSNASVEQKLLAIVLIKDTLENGATQAKTWRFPHIQQVWCNKVLLLYSMSSNAFSFVSVVYESRHRAEQQIS